MPKNEIEIEYDSNSDFNNYYSLDNGETWIPYTGAIEKSSITKNFKAKSISKKWKDLYSISDELKVEETIGNNAFDNNLETFEQLYPYPIGGKFYIELDDSIIGKSIDISIAHEYASGLGGGASINFVNENSEIIKVIKQLGNGGEKFDGREIEIPTNAKYIEINIAPYGGVVKIFEIKINKLVNLLPIITEDSQNSSVRLSVSDNFESQSKWWYATDGDLSTAWITDSGNYNAHWYQVEFNVPKVVSAYRLYGAYTMSTFSPSSAVAYQFYIEASNDGNSWTKLEGDEIHTGPYNTGAIPEYYIEFNNKTPYKYYRIYFPSGGWTWGSSGGSTICELQLLGEQQ